MISIRFGFVGIGLALATAGVTAIVACSSGDASAPPDENGSGGFGNNGGNPGGGNPGGGGTTGTGGTMVSLGGQASTTDIKIVGSTVQCPGTTPNVPAGQIPSCNIAGCTAAHCVPAANIPQGQDTALLAACTGGFCTPDDFIATNAQFLVKTCTSLEGAEGRCISTCVPQVNQQLTTLPKDSCAATELCAPCYNPIDGTDTKACSQGCDTGPTKPKVVFESCGGGLGVCVPPALVPPNLQTPLKNADDPTATTCTKTDSAGAKYLCAPTEKARDLNYQFPKCEPTLAAILNPTPGPNGQKGACVPKFLVPAAKQVFVAQDTCMANEVCAPCHDPTSTPPNAETGACPAG